MQPDWASDWRQLDTLRLLFALIVVASHTMYMFFRPMGYTALVPAYQQAAYLAVLAFFVLSGLVIGRTLRIRRDGFAAFMWRRVLRLYPPLLACFVLMVLLSGALGLLKISNLDATDVSFKFDVRPALLCLFTFGLLGQLSSSANGALWSLVLEMRCYLWAGLIAYLLLSRPAGYRRIAVAGCLLVLIALVYRDRGFALCYVAFAAGAVCSLFVDSIPKFIPSVRVDFSYSLYILHFPMMVAAALIAYNVGSPSLTFVAIVAFSCIILTITLAWASARWIESLRSLPPLAELFRPRGLSVVFEGRSQH